MAFNLFSGKVDPATDETTELSPEQITEALIALIGHPNLSEACRREFIGALNFTFGDEALEPAKPDLLRLWLPKVLAGEGGAR